MPRLPFPDPAALSAEARGTMAALPPDPMVKMLAHASGTLKPFVEFAKALVVSTELSARSRELVILTVAEYTESEFVAAQHAPSSLAAGVSDSTRQLVRRRQFESAELTEGDRSLLAFTSAVLGNPRIPVEEIERIRNDLSDREVVEVLQIIGYYWAFARISTILDVEITDIYGSVLSAEHD